MGNICGRLVSLLSSQGVFRTWKSRNLSKCHIMRVNIMMNVEHVLNTKYEYLTCNAVGKLVPALKLVGGFSILAGYKTVNW